MDLTAKTKAFEKAHPQLLGVAYRMLGSIDDAEDAVQDTGVKWLAYDGPAPDSATAWLTRVCTNRCLDVLKSAHKKRVDYVGPWLPELLQTEFDAGPEDQVEIASSLTTAFLLLLERLTPKERAAYLLHDIFSKPFDEVSEILDLQPANCRQLAARARKFVHRNQVRHVPDKAHQNALLQAFQSAVKTGDVASLGTMLCSDVDLRADSGGKVTSVLKVLAGPGDVCGFVGRVLSRAWANTSISIGSINGGLGLVVREGDQSHAAVSFAFDADDKVQSIFIMRHPDKLGRLLTTTGVADITGALRLH